MIDRRTNFDYVTVGHVTVDVLSADSARRPGGGAFYSALQATRLGLRTLIVTQGVASEIEALLEPYRAELELRIIPAAPPRRSRHHGRAPRVPSGCSPGPARSRETVEVDTQILHFAPVARETTRAAWRGHADFVGLTPQGLARTWDGEETDGEIVSAPLPGGRQSLDGLIPDGCKAVVVSEQERAACAPLLSAAAAGGAVVAITAGAGATSVQHA